MAENLRDSVSRLLDHIDALEGEERVIAEKLAVQNINALRTWLDAAIGWFHYPEDEKKSNAGSSTEQEIVCPHCNNPIKVRVSK